MAAGGETMELDFVETKELVVLIIERMESKEWNIEELIKSILEYQEW